MSITSEEYQQLLKNQQTKKKNKYGASPKHVDGYYFPSKLEGSCYQLLKNLQKEGNFNFFLRQIPFDIPGHKTHRVDFCIFFHNRVEFVECKGIDLAIGKLKREQVEELYKITIHVVKKIEQIYDLIYV